MSLPSFEDLEALGYRRVPPLRDCCAPDERPLPEAQMSLRLRIAEGKLAAAEARIARLEAALRRHTRFFTDSHDTELCGGCLEPSPCPDAGLLP